MNAFFRTSSIFFLFFLSVVFSVLDAQNLSISNARITTGGKTSQVLPQGAGAFLCFTLTNSDSEEQYLILSIRSEKAQGADQFFSAEFLAPAGSVQQCQFPFQLDSSRSYKLSADVPVKFSETDLLMFPLAEDQRLNLTVTDDVPYTENWGVNSYCNLEGYPKNCAVETVSGEAVPMSAHQLEHYRVILLYKTDFSKWHAKSFDAMREYVQNGGTLCFGTPQDAYNAQQTSLAELVPLEFFRPQLRKATSTRQLIRLKKNITTITLTYMSVRPVEGAVKMRKADFFERPFGKGMVRASSFDIWQFPETLSAAGYGEVLGVFLAGTPIPVRPIVYTHTRLEKLSSRPAFAFPEGRSLFAVLIFMLGGVVLLYLAELILKRIYGDDVKKWYVYTAILIWCAGVLLLGCVKGGLLFDWVLPRGEAGTQQTMDSGK